MHLEEPLCVPRSLDALPGVESSALSCCLPLETVWYVPLIIQVRSLDGRSHAYAGWTFVSAGYFEILHILRGRTFTERDDAWAPGVVVIHEALARRLWPNGDPLNGAESPAFAGGLDDPHPREPHDAAKRNPERASGGQRGLAGGRIRGLEQVAVESTAHAHEQVIVSVLRRRGLAARLGRHLRVKGLFGRTAEA